LTERRTMTAVQIPQLEEDGGRQPRPTIDPQGRYHGQEN
jgi:hypothetical protein